MGKKVHHISKERLTVAQIETIISGDYILALSEEARTAIVKCREFLDLKIKKLKHLIQNNRLLY